MEKSELIFSLYELFQALVEDIPIPEGGHPGYQEALIAELLDQTLGFVHSQLDDAHLAPACSAAWTSFALLGAELDAQGTPYYPLVDDLVIDWESPDAYRADGMTIERWREILVEPGGIPGEFLWDEDYLFNAVMDQGPEDAKELGQVMGLDLNAVHRLPHTPSEAELRMAKHYLGYISAKFDVEGG